MQMLILLQGRAREPGVDPYLSGRDQACRIHDKQQEATPA